MSLINQMLKDLEQRTAGSANSETPTSIGISPSKLQASSFPVIKIGLLLILLLGGVYSWLHTVSKSKPDTDAATQVIPQITANANELRKQNVVEVPAPVTHPATSTTSEPLFESGLKNKSSNHQVQTTKQEKEVKHALAETTVAKPDIKQDVKQIEPSLQSAANSSNETEKITERKHMLSRLTTKLSSENLAGNKEVNGKEIGGKEISKDQKSKNYYSQAISNLKQGRVSEAQANLNQALEVNQANQEARQTLAGLLLDNKRIEEAKTTLIAGLAITPEQSDFRIALARIQVESGDRILALSTLEQGLTYAQGNADYQSFLATLLQRVGQHDEAIQHYMSAISLGTATPSTLVGIGISLQAAGQLDKAKEFFANAQTNTSLTPELSAFVEQRLKQINQQLRN